MLHKYSEPKTALVRENGLKTAVIGARGYAGTALARLLAGHPGVASVTALSTDSGFGWASIDPAARWSAGLSTAAIAGFDPSSVDAIFLATPAEASIGYVRDWRSRANCLIDLSGAYRLTAEKFAAHYGTTHGDPEGLAEAHYGLVPFAGPAAGKLIANPGCYATAVELALIPIVRAGLVDVDTIVIDAKSGTTGAGKSAKENLLFSEVDGECVPYRIGAHQHAPEIARAVERFAGARFVPWFTPHLIPAKRGILASVYARATAAASPKALAETYAEAFAGYGLASVRDLAAHDAETNRRFLSLASVTDTGEVRIGFQLAGDRLHVFAVIDNLMKGAASQAVENLNRFFDLPVTMGIEPALQKGKP